MSIFLPVAVSKGETQSPLTKMTLLETSHLKGLKINWKMFYVRNYIRKYTNIMTHLLNKD